MNYRCVAASPEGLVQQLATSYLRHGYWFYVTGYAKAGLDLAALDQKLYPENIEAALGLPVLADVRLMRRRWWDPRPAGLFVRGGRT